MENFLCNIYKKPTRSRGSVRERLAARTFLPHVATLHAHGAWHTRTWQLATVRHHAPHAAQERQRALPRHRQAVCLALSLLFSLSPFLLFLLQFRARCLSLVLNLCLNPTCLRSHQFLLPDFLEFSVVRYCFLGFCTGSLNVSLSPSVSSVCVCGGIVVTTSCNANQFQLDFLSQSIAPSDESDAPARVVLRTGEEAEEAANASASVSPSKKRKLEPFEVVR